MIRDVATPWRALTLNLSLPTSSGSRLLMLAPFSSQPSRGHIRCSG